MKPEDAEYETAIEKLREMEARHLDLAKSLSRKESEMSDEEIPALAP